MQSLKFSQYTDDELRSLLSRIRGELRTRKNANHNCLVCGDLFAGRLGAQYCSTRCRTAAHRLKAASGRKNTHTSQILGFGYEGKNLDELITSLQGAGITTLVDVRLNAISRKRGFSKTALREALVSNGIGYEHFRSLGNQRDNREGYSETGTLAADTARDRFRKTLQSEPAEAALREVRELAARQQIALFCYEHDSSHCHREQVIEALSS